MTQNFYQRIVAKTYGGNRNISQLGEERMESIREAILDLRRSYRSDVCDMRYGTDENRRAYMLAYYPNYIEPARQIVSRFVIPALEDYQSFYPVINLAFFAGGPCPELYGTMKAFQGKKLYDQAVISILDKERGWKPEQNASWQLCREDGLLHKHDKGGIISQCDNLGRCKDCKHDQTCQQRIYKNANVYFMQNFLTHVQPTEEAHFLKKMRACFEQAKKRAVFVIMDLNYSNSLRLLQELDDLKDSLQSNVETIGTNIYQSNGPDRVQCPFELPRELRENIFTGENYLVPKIWTKYYYLVLQKY